MICITKNAFYLSDGDFSYAFLSDNGKLRHTYYGKYISFTDDGGNVRPVFRGELLRRGSASAEYSEFGRGDFGIYSVFVQGPHSMNTDFRYRSHEILSEKPHLPFPALRDGGETLKVVLSDDRLGAELRLYYTVYDGALIRRAEIVNTSAKTLILHKLASACVSFPAGEYSLLHLSGRPTAERTPFLRKLDQGTTAIDSERGISSHQHNPFIATTEGSADETHGNVFGFNLVYGGNFSMECEVDERNCLRVAAGIKISETGIPLKPAQTFFSPEVVMVYSDEGFGKMSRRFHKLYREHLINPRFANKPRPIVLNSWESMVFNFDESKFIAFTEHAKGLGIDTIVMDDGWFGHRDNDDSSLGDWFVDRKKFPNGLKNVIDACKLNGMRFGIWFEPEAISEDSELYAAHPEWAISSLGREHHLIRQQCVLDFSKKEVVDHIFKCMKKILDAYEISYIKWDMNRSLTDVCDAETYYLYTQGVYSLYERISDAYPDVVIEGCAGGGGRFDPSVLYYSPFIWTSDNTDASCRARIQYGTSYCYPLQSMSNHVSASPCLQTGRRFPMDTRINVASLGCLGYELRPMDLTEEERKLIATKNGEYRKNRDLILNGDLYRLLDPFTNNGFAELIVSENKESAYFVYMKFLHQSWLPNEIIRLQGLDENACYRIEELNKVYSARELMYAGLCVDVPFGDYTSVAYKLTKV